MIAPGIVHFGNRILEKHLQGFPGTTAETGKKLSVVKKITAKDLRDADMAIKLAYSL